MTGRGNGTRGCNATRPGRRVIAGVPLLAGLVALAGIGTEQMEAQADEPASFPVPRIVWDPTHYVCYRAAAPVVIDGRLSEAAWQQAAWTDDFVDIEGSQLRPAPRFRTRVKMLWDERYFYVAAEMEEPDVWAKLTERDAVIYRDNDFEVFIDPDGDTHEYYELELNAFGTEWDLLLVRPYRDGGPAVHAWDIQGLETAVEIDGTLNLPGDRDVGWSVEIAFPWPVLRECAHCESPPAPGDQWRVNFSRVEWQTEAASGEYVKLTDPATGRSLPENNWVWSPQGLIAMHYPEMWGYVQFSDRIAGDGEEPFLPPPAGAARWALRRLYYAQKAWHAEHGVYAEDVESLGLGDPGLETFAWPPVLSVTPSLFEASLIGGDGGRLHITQDGRIWSVTPDQ